MASAGLEVETKDWLRATAQTELLRFTTAGSVDDGKSTLIGRLLYDSKGVYEDQLASVRKATRNQTGGGLDLSLLTDGLRAEREQGITIDVAYRYFSTPRRKFIIADTPGHEQYTRNMATGASTANLAVILIDARYGVLPQSRRHAYIASLLGIPHLVVAVNKMDLVEFREEVFTAIREEFLAFTRRLGLPESQFIPLSALEGDNVVQRSKRTPWYTGPSLLEHLETVPLAADHNLTNMRFPVQYVIRPNLDFRGFAGQVASGVIHRGDEITALPSGQTSRVKSIVTWDGELEEAFSPMSVTVCLEDEIDVSRGDMLAPTADLPHAGRRFEASVVWMNERRLLPHRPYLLKHTTQTVHARVREIRHRVDINTLAHRATDQLQLNEIGVVSIEAQRPLFFDTYRKNRAAGGFILIDPITNETVGAGMILEAGGSTGPTGRVTLAEREVSRGHSAFTICLPAGMQDLAYELERRLFEQGCLVHVIDGPENLRQAAATAYAAGLVSIVICAQPADLAAVQRVVPAARLMSIAAEEANLEDAARRIWSELELSGRLAARRDPLTDGAGI
ncbi:MAG TPA: sulfate adenylyltransferase subunit CysN [Bryobacteraceae bacterium]|nr:sulfate adenylyltransferase subunit CysN [Bryobacteraceae bacterium]